MTATPAPSRGLKTYSHTQYISSAVWSITHNLNRYPKVVVIDSSGSLEEVFGDVHYTDLNSLDIIFGSPFTGGAYLS